MDKIRAVVLDPDKDNVAVALADLEPGETINLKSGPVKLKEKIPWKNP